MFGLALITAATLMHLHVYWRARAVPPLRRLPRRVLPGAMVALWGLFVLGRVYGHHGQGALARVLEWSGMNWLATLFLIFTSLVLAELITCFGFLLRAAAPTLRGLAMLAGCALAGVALVQGARAPVVERYEARLAELPDALDGAVIVGLSDLHIGSLIGPQWLAGRLEQVATLEPDAVVLLGDLFEGHGEPLAGLLPLLEQLDAPQGVYVVPGNHESRAALELMRRAGFHLLLDRWVEVQPGLVLAGVDDERRRDDTRAALTAALVGRPPGATILLSHRPEHVEVAAASGVQLMLSGHTHGGQIWPFGYLVALRYPLLKGAYLVDSMQVIVCRGTGGWGPRMRLFERGEIMHVTLRSAPKPR